MIKNNQYQDEALRSVMRQRAEKSERMKLSEDFTDRLMQRIEQTQTASVSPIKDVGIPRVWLYTLRTVLSTAAIYLIGLFFWLQQEPVKPVQMVAQEQSDIHEIDNNRCTEGTPLELYMCYMEQKREQPNTYSILRQRFYGNER